MAPHALEGVYLFDLRFLKGAVAVGDGAFHALGDGAPVNTSHGDASGIVGIVERGDEHLGRSLQLFGGGDYLNDFVEQIVDGVSGFVVVRSHPSVLCRTIYHGEVELVLGGVEVAHEVEDHFVDLFGAAVGFVHLVDHHDGFQSDLQSLLQDKACLRHRAFKGIDEQDAAVGHIEHTFHLSAKIGVARCVNDIDFGVFVSDGNVFRQDGDTPFPFQVVIVENKFSGVLVFSEQIARQQHFVDECGFAVVDVGNNRNVSYVLHIGK